MASTKEVIVSKVDIAKAKLEEKKDVVAREAPLHMFLGGIHYVSFLCSPTSLRELVVGHLLGEGIAASLDEIESITFDPKNACHVTLRKTNVGEHVVLSKPYAQLIVSACGSIGHKSLAELLDTIELKPLPRWQIPAMTISSSVKKLNAIGETFRETGGVHMAVLYENSGELAELAEDVGRHNAVDKVIGSASLNGRNLGECFLALSGRLSGDVVLKAARVGIPIVASLAAALDSGIEVAKKAKVTLIGFVRGSRMNVYTHPKRVKL